MSSDAFWRWFVGIDQRLRADIEDHDLLRELDRRIRQLGDELSWEVGPGLSKPWQLVISPNLDPDRLHLTKAIVSRAPTLPDWEFHASRQPKDWNYQLELGDAPKAIHIDASEWTFVLLRYPDGAHEILLHARNLPTLTDDQRWQAAAITLESILGEEAVLEKAGEFELVEELEERFAAKQKPIRELRKAVLGP